ncbi:universal stress protein [Streptomyces sp. NBC_01794]|uniref:universal stress protein n=1 Tax=unclassified Streptomyces TaxID=2593676 RepID=UPI0038734917
MHAWTLPPAYTYAVIADPGISLEMGRQVARTLSDLLLPWRQKHPSVRVVERAVFGPSASELVCASADAELIVVGRRARHATLGALIGPVTHAVLHHAASPIAVVAHD